jgi:5-(carboxyamino)imidazole ribonucleotide synthase
VNFEREVSFLGARSASGDLALYPATENRHRNGVLLTSLAPAPELTPAVDALGRDYLTRLLTQTGYVGMLAMECFVVGEQLLVNELAPRVHNSGHWTLHSEVASQFENHLRAIMGITLGDTRLYRCEGMINILGGYDRDRLLHALPREAVLVDYNKTASPGRKLGHITVADRERDAVVGELARLHDLLYGGDADRDSGAVTA